MMILVIIAIAIGAYVRFDQFLVQTLIDDEWHAVHQLLHSTPTKIATSFGHADYSIPLTLLYWFEAKFFGLSELMMRWPMMLFGLATIIIFPIYVYRHGKQLEAVVFGLLLSLSPVLTIYSRTARPYAVTLFLCYLSIWAFYQYYQKSNKHWRYLIIYSVSTAFAVWLHLIVAFFIFSPFAVEMVRLVFNANTDRKKDLIKLIAIGIPVLLLTFALVLPPLLHDFNALTVKAGTDLPSFDTLTGALYLWFGTQSGAMLIVSMVLALIGLPGLIKQSAIMQSVLTGFVLTVAIIFVSQPAWVQHPLTFSRYLLPVIPLLLLAVASGICIMHQQITNQWNNKPGSLVFNSVCLVLISGFIASSPLAELLRHPNRNTLHSVFSFEFRPEKNKIDHYIHTRSFSKFWDSFADSPPVSQKIAVAPWYFESFHWDAPVWEKISNQAIIPGYLLGLCVKQRAGEVPDSQRFQFRNTSYLAKPQDLDNRAIDYIVYQKKKRLKIKHPYSNIGGCSAALQKLYGKPVFEDTLIKVFHPNLSNSHSQGIKIIDK